MNNWLFTALAVGVKWLVVILLCCKHQRTYSVKELFIVGKEFGEFSQVIEVLTRKLPTGFKKNQEIPAGTTANFLVEMRTK
jgi:hypothetical protein